MGYMRHHAIIVTSFDGTLLEQAHVKAVDLGMAVTPIVADNVNFYSSFLVAPDGSKEGWDESDRGDVRRAALVDWLDAQRHADGSSNLNWVELQYGDDDGDTHVVRDSDYYYRVR